MRDRTPANYEANRIKRPFSVTCLALVVFSLAGVNAGRVGVSLADWDLWAGFNLPFSLSLRIALSAVWAGALGVTAWGLWGRRRWARHWTLALFPLYQLYEFGWRFAFVKSDYERGRMPFVLASIAGVTGVVVWILTRRKFERNGEQGEESNGE